MSWTSLDLMQDEMSIRQREAPLAPAMREIHRDGSGMVWTLSSLAEVARGEENIKAAAVISTLAGMFLKYPLTDSWFARVFQRLDTVAIGDASRELSESVLEALRQLQALRPSLASATSVDVSLLALHIERRRVEAQRAAEHAAREAQRARRSEKRKQATKPPPAPTPVAPAPSARAAGTPRHGRRFFDGDSSQKSESLGTGSCQWCEGLLPAGHRRFSTQDCQRLHQSEFGTASGSARRLGYDYSKYDAGDELY